MLQIILPRGFSIERSLEEFFEKNSKNGLGGSTRHRGPRDLDFCALRAGRGAEKKYGRDRGVGATYGTDRYDDFGVSGAHSDS